MAKQGTVSTEGLTLAQKDFTINVMAMLLDKLIQDDMDVNDDGTPKAAKKQQCSTIKQAMMILNYK